MPDLIHLVPQYPEHRPGRADRIAGVILHLLFDLTQETARFGSSSNPWTHLAAYDTDAFAAFLPGELA
ncbi:hypothetical protein PV735_31985 [Streptomyces turgidiscabies]|uniref:Uncharacterized protein n=1 Tax=Streptomyces turgidiscabies (strain Car8) TaxID=698760 RepID=L7EPU5_STRT8|nr:MULTISPECIES: hypothetical protein [Streptomyces]ELP61493.1 hypothetical protein STRTUCAR8_03664 [Streptomyces turgidiscabies Car8]MDX3497273.1 hypothetical protein [Streptomyces turgidiscabies]GAQ68630.1 hypothetical protein T45_00342 [Streptomyces turgidiscabies]